MRIYGHPLSTCTQRVLLTLTEKAGDAQFVVVDLLSGAQRLPDHLARHPFAKIPVLEHDDLRLYESRAIARYLDATLPGIALTPTSLLARARMDQWLSVDQSYVDPSIKALVRERVVKPRLGVESSQADIDHAQQTLAHAFDVIDRALSQQPFLVGEQVSLADLSLLPYAVAITHLGATDLVTLRPHLAAWRQRMTQRPAWQAMSERTQAAMTAST